MADDARPCERLCPSCGEWKHHSRFRTQKRSRQGSVSTTFRALCKACEQIARNERKNTDRALAIIEGRARSHARTLGVAASFLLVNMNWRALVPVMRGMLTPEALCLACGHPFLNERDVQIEHHEPPRHAQDWPRQHARNLGLACASCNRTKGDRPFAVWLDEQDDARRSNDAHRTTTADPGPPVLAGQLSLLDPDPNEATP